MSEQERAAFDQLRTEAWAVVNRLNALANTGRRIVRDDINVGALEQALRSIPTVPAEESAGKKAKAKP